MLTRVTIREAGTRGRGVFVSERPVAAGVSVLEEIPYACVLYDEAIALRCDWCLEPSSSLLRCSKSLLSRYCSREHQRAAWNAGYKDECAALVACSPRVPPSTVRLAARVLWRRAREQGKGIRNGKNAPHSQAAPSECTATFEQDVATLVHHWFSLSDSRKTEFAQMAVLLRHFMTGEAGDTTGQDPELPQAEGMPVPESVAISQSQHDSSSCSSSSLVAARGEREAASAAAIQLPSIREMALLLARFACNNHTICDEELRPIGVGLYPRGSMVNHDCQPNCMQSFTSQGRIMFRSLRSLSPGEEISISYVELAATRQERRQMLLDTYHWDIDQEAGNTAGPVATAAAAEAGAAAAAVDTAAEAAAEAAHVAAAAARVAEAAAVTPMASGVILEVSSSSNTHTTWHGSMTHPPWQWDPRDTVLTQVVTQTFSALSSTTAVLRGKQDPVIVVAGGLTASVVQETSSEGTDADMSFDTEFVDIEDEQPGMDLEMAENIHAGISSGSSRILPGQSKLQPEGSPQLTAVAASADRSPKAGLPIVNTTQRGTVNPVARSRPEASKSEFIVHVDCWGLTGEDRQAGGSRSGFPAGVRELAERVSAGLVLQQRGVEAVAEGNNPEASGAIEPGEIRDRIKIGRRHWRNWQHTLHYLD